MQAVFKFLKKLASNNNKDWFDAHKDEYLEAKEMFEQYVDGLIKEIIRFDKKIDPSTTGKNSTFRIYKDVRFSKDKTPYKIHLAASINPGGRKSPFAGYYFHVQPGNSFIAGGVWMPEPEALQAIRQEIDYNPKPLLKILSSPAFKKYFKGLDEDGKLKTAPKGFEKDHPHIDLLKNRNFIVSHAYSDKQILSPGSQKEVIKGLKGMHPLMEYLRQAQDQ